MPKIYEATLVRGQTYGLGNLQFVRGVPVQVDEVQKKKLETNGVERATMISGDEKEVQILAKFKFKLVGDVKPENTKAGRLAALAEMSDAKGDVDFDDDEAAEDDEESEDADYEGDEDTADTDADEPEEEPAPVKKAPAKKPAAKPASARRR